ncbi:MAG: protein of unknown function transrane [Oscillospiraceae bacterium]|jgi:drug/metabolite transporter (DMT)-like permease|nr:protein of unknown function transrane [Oscillospiraceae bacterium]
MKRAYFKYVFALLLFGSNGIVANQISLTSYEIVFLRTMIGSFMLLAIFLFTRGRFTFWQHKQQFLFLLISGIAMGASWMFLYEAYRQVGVSIASLAYYCGPVIVMVLSPFLFREKLTRSKIVGFLVVIFGIVLVNQQVFQAGKASWGLFCGGMSAVMYAFMVNYNKKVKDITGLENSTLQLTISFLTVAVFLGIRQGLIILPSSGDAIWILVLGLLNTGIGCYFYFSSIGYLPVQTVAICGYLEPLSAVLLSAVILRETMSVCQICGTVMIIGGAIIGEFIFFEKM